MLCRARLDALPKDASDEETKKAIENDMQAGNSTKPESPVVHSNFTNSTSANSSKPEEDKDVEAPPEDVSTHQKAVLFMDNLDWM